MTQENTQGFGWIVDDQSEAKKQADGALGFAKNIIEGTAQPCVIGTCPTCSLLDESMACMGVIEQPFASNAEQYLFEKLPKYHDSLPAQSLIAALKDNSIKGDGGRALREQGFTENKRNQYRRLYGSFFRRRSVTSDQLLELLFCATPIQPSHALALLFYFDAITVDGRAPMTDADGEHLADIMQYPDTRDKRTACIINIHDDQGSVLQVKRLLRGLYAAFIQDVECLVIPALHES